MRKVKLTIGAGAVGAALLTGAVVAPPGLASAAVGSTAGAAVSDRVTAIKDALAGLVSNGTLTQTQADTVANTLAEQFPGHGGHHRGSRGVELNAAATALGMSEDQLRQELAAGKTLAQIAQEKGVSTDTLVQALVDAATSRLDQAVAGGRLTQAEADQRKADLPAQVRALLDKTLPAHGPGRPGRPGGHDMDDAGSPTPMPSSSAPTQGSSATTTGTVRSA